MNNMNVIRYAKNIQLVERLCDNGKLCSTTVRCSIFHVGFPILTLTGKLGSIISSIVLSASIHFKQSNYKILLV